MKVVCRGCSSQLKAPPKLYGKVVKCPKCKNPISIPLPQDAEVRTPQVAKPPVAPPPIARKPIEPQRPSPAPVPQASVETTDPATSKSPLPILALAGAAICVTALIAAALFWFLRGGNENVNANAESVANEKAMVKAADRKPNDSNAVASVSEMPVMPVPETNPITIPDLRFDFGRPSAINAYEVRIKYDVEGEETVAARGDMVFVTKNPISTVRAESAKTRVFRRSGLPAHDVFTGLGIPGNRIIVPSELTEQADLIEFTFKNEKYTAEVAEEYPDERFSVLVYEGPEFPPPPISNVNELFGTANALQFDTQGEVEALVEVEIHASKATGGMAGNMYRPWQSAVLYTHWGTVAGLTLPQGTNSNRIIGMAQIAKHFDRNVFDVQTIDPQTTEEIVRTAKQNLVEVTVSRPSRTEGGVSLFYKHEFDRPYRNGKIEFPRYTFYAKAGHERLKILKSGRFDSEVHPSHLLVFPPGIVSAQGAALFEIQPNKMSWNERAKLIAVSKEESKVKFIEERNIEKEMNSGAVVFKLMAEVRILDYADDLAKIERKFTIAPYPEEQTNETGYQCNATQLIDFDVKRGKVIDSKINGDIYEEDFHGRFEISLNLLDEAAALSAYFGMQRSRQYSPASPSKTRKLDPAEVQGLVDMLLSGETEEYREAIVALYEIQAEPNEQISNAIAAGYVTYGRNDTNSLRVYRNWLLSQHVPQVLEGCVEQLKEKKRRNKLAIMQLLIIHPRLPDTHLGDIEKIVQSEMDYQPKAAIAVLTAKYPDLIDPISIDYLESVPKDVKRGIAFARVLGELGSANCIEPLKAYGSKAKKQTAGNGTDPIYEAIEKIQQRESNGE